LRAQPGAPRGQGAPASQPGVDDQPYAIEYYYKAKWGYADEFIRLFKKNHYPILKKQVESGRFLQVTAVRPRYHTTEDGRWDYRVTIVFKNASVANDSSGEDAIIKQLYPDQETYRRGGQRRCLSPRPEEGGALVESN